MAKTSIDYFEEVSDPTEKAIRLLKGTERREWFRKIIKEQGVDSIPPDWRGHELPEHLKHGLTRGGGPQARGGEDLPDVNQNEVEIAKMVLFTTVHGEVVSLRASQAKVGNLVSISLVDEYEQDIYIPHEECEVALTPEQVIECFLDGDPNPNPNGYRVRLESQFYPQLDEVYDAMLRDRQTSERDE